MPTLSAINRAITRICAIGAGASLAAVFGIIFFNSLRRYTIGKSLEWGEEMPIYLTIYGIMFGSALAYLHDRHVRFTFLTDLLTPRLRERLLALVDLVMIVTGGLLAYSGWLFMLKRGGVEASGIIGPSKGLADTTGLPWLEALGHMAVWQFSMTLGGAILSLAALLKFIERSSTLSGRRG